MFERTVTCRQVLDVVVRASQVRQWDRRGLGSAAFAVEGEGTSEEAAVNDAFTSNVRFTVRSNKGMSCKRQW